MTNQQNYTTHKQMKEALKSGQQTVSYWAGMRLEGPIQPHEKREVFMTKL